MGGRSLALATLDKMLARSCNQAALQRALEKNFRADPVKFFRTMIMPLMPREAKVSMDQEGIVQWTSLLVSGGRALSQGGDAPALGAAPEAAGRERAQSESPALPSGDVRVSGEMHGTDGTV